MRVKDKTISLSLNWYRNAHHFEQNDVKVKFKDAVAEALMLSGLSKSKKLPHPLKFTYRYFFKRKCDTGNFHTIIEKFFLDALVEFEMLPEDNCEIVSGGDYEFGGYDRQNPRVEISIGV